MDPKGIEISCRNHRCIHQLFEEQVERTPENRGFIFANESLTYRQINQKANQLAHYLRRAGIGPEALVSLCVDRSPGTRMHGMWEGGAARLLPIPSA